jgi:hypothetical protein
LLIRSHVPDRPRVLAACFAGLYEMRFLEPALDGIAELDQVQNRSRLPMRVASIRPSLLVVPAVDAAGVATAALVENCVLTAPDVPVLVVVPAHMTVGRAIARAVESGGQVVSVMSARELRAAVARVLAGRTLPEDDFARLKQLLKGLQPRALAHLLRDSILAAHERIDVERLADLGERSRSSMARDLKDAGWPAPGEFIVWSRLFRAGLANHPSTMSIVALAHIGGFSAEEALIRACNNLLGIRGAIQATLGAGRVGLAFRARLGPRNG